MLLDEGVPACAEALRFRRLNASAPFVQRMPAESRRLLIGGELCDFHYQDLYTANRPLPAAVPATKRVRAVSTLSAPQPTPHPEAESLPQPEPALTPQPMPTMSADASRIAELEAQNRSLQSVVNLLMDDASRQEQQTETEARIFRACLTRARAQLSKFGVASKADPLLSLGDIISALRGGNMHAAAILLDEMRRADAELTPQTQEAVEQRVVAFAYFLANHENKQATGFAKSVSLSAWLRGMSDSGIEMLRHLGVGCAPSTLYELIKEVVNKHAAEVARRLQAAKSCLLVMNIDDYHNGRGLRIPAHTSTSLFHHMATSLVSVVTNEPAFTLPEGTAIRYVDRTVLERLLRSVSSLTYAEEVTRRPGADAHARGPHDDDALTATLNKKLFTHVYAADVRDLAATRTQKDVILLDCAEGALKSCSNYASVVANLCEQFDGITEYTRSNLLIGVFDGPGAQALMRLSVQASLNARMDNAQFFKNTIALLDPLHISLNAQEGAVCKNIAFFRVFYKHLFPRADPLADKPKAWRITFLLILVDSGWSIIRHAVLERFATHKSHELSYLLNLLEEQIPAALDVFCVLHKGGRAEFVGVVARIWSTMLHQLRRRYDKLLLVLLSALAGGSGLRSADGRHLHDVLLRHLQRIHAQYVETCHARIRANSTDVTTANRLREIAILVHDAVEQLGPFQDKYGARRRKVYGPKDFTGNIARAASALATMLIDAHAQSSSARLERVVVRKTSTVVLHAPMLGAVIAQKLLPLAYSTTSAPSFEKLCSSPSCAAPNSEESLVPLSCGHRMHKACAKRQCVSCLAFRLQRVRTLVAVIAKGNAAEIEQLFTEEDESEDESDDDADDEGQDDEIADEADASQAVTPQKMLDDVLARIAAV